MRRKKSDALAIVDPKMVDFGKALLAQSDIIDREDMMKNTVEEVRNLRKMIAHAEDNRDKTTKALSIYNQRLEAIRKGRFTVVTGSGPSMLLCRIEYTDAELNKVY